MRRTGIWIEIYLDGTSCYIDYNKDPNGYYVYNPEMFSMQNESTSRKLKKHEIVALILKGTLKYESTVATLINSARKN